MFELDLGARWLESCWCVRGALTPLSSSNWERTIISDQYWNSGVKERQWRDILPQTSQTKPWFWDVQQRRLEETRQTGVCKIHPDKIIIKLFCPLSNSLTSPCLLLLKLQQKTQVLGLHQQSGWAWKEIIRKAATLYLQLLDSVVCERNTLLFLTVYMNIVKWGSEFWSQGGKGNGLMPPPVQSLGEIKPITVCSGNMPVDSEQDQRCCR